MTRDELDLLEELALGEVPLMLFSRTQRAAISRLEADGLIALQGRPRLVLLTERGIIVAIDHSDPVRSYSFPTSSSRRSRIRETLKRYRSRLATMIPIGNRR